MYHHGAEMRLVSRRQLLQAAGCLVATACSSHHPPRHAPDRAGAAATHLAGIGTRVAEYTASNQLNSVDYPTVCCAYGLLPSLAVTSTFSGALVGNGMAYEASSRSVPLTTSRTTTRNGPVGSDSV